MNMEQANRVLRQVARRNGVSVEEVIREIEEVIRTSMANPETRGAWEAIPRTGEFPTAAEALAYLAQYLSHGGFYS